MAYVVPTTGMQPITALLDAEIKLKRPIMKLFRLRTFDEYVAYSRRVSSLLEEHEEYLRSITPAERIPFSVQGFSYTAQKQVEFLVDYKHAGETAGVVWRERVSCPKTNFNNRMRATFHLFDIEMEPYPDLSLYISEQLTPIYKNFKKIFPNTVGSEYFGANIPKGFTSVDGIRNEDLCHLSFADQSFDAVVSLDVFEHIPAYFDSFMECARILKPGGKLMWSVPFVSSAKKNIIKARLVGGQVEHIITPPEYHGDPLSPEGILCFQHFGWEMLDEMKRAGFRDAYAICYQSAPFGYLGGEQFMFFAIK